MNTTNIKLSICYLKLVLLSQGRIKRYETTGAAQVGKITSLGCELLLELRERASSCVLYAGTNYGEKCRIQQCGGLGMGERRLSLHGCVKAEQRRQRGRKMRRKMVCRAANTGSG